MTDDILPVLASGCNLRTAGRETGGETVCGAFSTAGRPLFIVGICRGSTSWRYFCSPGQVAIQVAGGENLHFELARVNFNVSRMNDQLPAVTVLIAARPGQVEIKAVTAGRQLDYPPEKLEIIVARGKQPSVQRNQAMRAARGELIYFLDDDSTPGPDSLRRTVAAFADPKVQMVGGPNLCPPDAPFLEQVFALVHASWLAFFSSRARYAPVGARRESGEKELILCNLIARRGPMLELGGFNEALYPNEENALMDELKKRGGKLIYDPGLTVFRRPRPSPGAFCKMLLNYGRGRAEQFRVYPTAGSIANFAPSVLCVYLAALPVLLWQTHPGVLPLAPLALYGAALLAQAAALVRQGGLVKSICAIPFVVLTHVLYGAGFFKGCFTTLKPAGKRPVVEVVLENVPLGALKNFGKVE